MRTSKFISILLLNVFAAVLLHERFFSVQFSRECFAQKVRTERAVPSKELYHLVSFLQENNIASSADCAANVPVLLWNARVLINPRIAISRDHRYDCTLFNGQIVKHGRYLTIAYDDLWFVQGRLEIEGKSEVCRFLAEFSKFS